MPKIAQKDGRALLRVGELAKRVGKTVRAIHLYEEMKLLKPVSRSSGGYRLYAEDAVTRLEWIAKLQAMGFSLPAIQEFVAMFESSSAAPTAMQNAREIFEAKLAETREQLARLRTLEHDLVASLAYLASCSTCEPSHVVGECGVCDHHGHQAKTQPELVAGLASVRSYDLKDTELVRHRTVVGERPEGSR